MCVCVYQGHKEVGFSGAVFTGSSEPSDMRIETQTRVF